MEQPTPADRRQRLITLAPFAGSAGLAFALVGSSGAVVAWGGFALAAAIMAVIGIVAVLVPPERLPRAARLAGPFAFLASAAMLREVAGGLGSGIGPLALLPVFWLALHGDRRELAVMLGAVAAFFLGPILFVGVDGYPGNGVRSAVLFMVLATIVGFTVQSLVVRIRAQAETAERREQDLEAVGRAARDVAASDDARIAVCRAAREISGGDFAVLFEPEGEGKLVSTAMDGLDVPPQRIVVGAERSATAIAFAEGRPVLAVDAASDPAVSPRIREATGRPAALRFEPVLRGEHAIGVLVVGWGSPRPEAATACASILRLLATEAAIAIGRADLVGQLADLALTDGLTGLGNRRAWEGWLATVVAQARRDRQPLTVAMLDLDHFKAYNDSRGHQGGDRLLKETTAAWREQLRPVDRLARYGGEEFAVLLPGCDTPSAAAVVERLRSVVPGEQTCSAGIASWDGGEPTEVLVRRADAALYAAKAAGRDRALTAP